MNLQTIGLVIYFCLPIVIEKQVEHSCFCPPHLYGKEVRNTLDLSSLQAGFQELEINKSVQLDSDCLKHYQGGILSCSAAAPLTEILVKDYEFLLHFGLE